MSTKLSKKTAALLVSALLTGCAAHTTVTGTWQEPRTVRAPFGNVLVVGVSPTSRQRRSFEQALVDLISKGSTKASASIKVAGSKQPLTPENLSAMVKTTGADAVLVTRLASRRVSLEEGESRMRVKTQQPSSLGDMSGIVDLFSTEYKEYEEPGALSARSTAVLTSSLFEAADGQRLVYAIETRAEFEEGKDDVIAQVTTAIAAQLRRDGLIR
jgi:tRNA-dihydrouridine synthase